MLIVSIPPVDAFDESTESFVSWPGGTLHLEHNLLSLSKWESITHKYLIGNDDVTSEELKLYIECMVQEEEFDRSLLDRIPPSELHRINEYIADPMTATRINTSKKGGSGEYTSSELIYYWMIACQIPFTCENWHINRLLTLIQVCNEKNQPNKKMSQSEIMARNRELNAQRRKALGTRG